MFFQITSRVANIALEGRSLIFREKIKLFGPIYGESYRASNTRFIQIEDRPSELI